MHASFVLCNHWLSTFSGFVFPGQESTLCPMLLPSSQHWKKILITISVIQADTRAWHLYRFKSEHVNMCWSYILMEAQENSMLAHLRQNRLISCTKLCFHIVSWTCVSFKAFGFAFSTFYYIEHPMLLKASQKRLALHVAWKFLKKLLCRALHSLYCTAAEEAQAHIQ